MKLSVRHRTISYLGFAVSLLVIASCGGGGGGGGGGTTGVDVDAPAIFDLIIRALDPERVNRNVRYVVAFNFTDQNGDVGNGECEVLLNNQSIGRVRIDPGPGGNPNATQGAVACGFVVRSFAPQQINGRVRIFDRAGHQSNELTFVLGIQAAKEATPEAATRAFEGRMESATIGR